MKTLLLIAGGEKVFMNACAGAAFSFRFRATLLSLRASLVLSLAVGNHVASAIENSCPLSSSQAADERILIEIFLKRKENQISPFWEIAYKINHRNQGEERRDLFALKIIDLLARP